MDTSAEIRWFWPGEGPPDLRTWFLDAARHGCAAGGGEPRRDDYLRDDDQSELGVKSRGGKPGLEIKGLVAVIGECRVDPFGGPIELWGKWSTGKLSLDGSTPSIPVEKRRWLRMFDTCSAQQVREFRLGAQERPIDGGAPPTEGCKVEFTEIRRGENERWTSLGFESFGTLDRLPESLRRTAALLASREAPALRAGRRASYPAWLKE